MKNKVHVYHNKVQLHRAVILCLLYCFMSGGFSRLHADFPLKSHGWITLEAYAHGQGEDQDRYRTHRSEFTQIVDVYTWKAFTFTWLLGNTTDIARYPDSSFYMDRITYTYTYGGRYDWGPLVIRGDMHHDCIHVINRPEISGSTWWNAYLLRIGTRGAFNLYLSESHQVKYDHWWKRLDGRVGMAYYKKAGQSLADGSNHEFKYEISNLLRFNVGSTKKTISYIDINQQLWLNRDETSEYKGSISINLLLKGQTHFAGLFYEYHYYDTFVKDREDGLGAIGFRILF